MNSKTYLCGFASSDLFLSKLRYLKQAKNLNFYKKIFFYGPEDLSTDVKKKINKYLLIGDRKIYGHGIWKPEIVYRSLLAIPDGSILQYSDVGFHFNPNGIEKLNYYQDCCDKYEMLVFQYRDPLNKQLNLKYLTYLEHEYTKSDLINYFNLKFDSPIINSPQISSGTFFLKKSIRTIKFIKDWSDTFNEMKLVDNSASVLPERDTFIQNRDDQSTFSILCKLNNIFSLSVYDHYEWALNKNGRDWSHLKDSPMQAKRDLKFISIRAFINNLRKIIKRKFLKR
jgi:hypothetical protein